MLCRAASLPQLTNSIHSVIVSAGLIALVDNTIRDRFHSKTAKQMLLPKVEYIGPKRFINEMFRRDSNGSEKSQSRPPTRSRPSTSHGSSSTTSRPNSTAVPRAVRQSSYE